MMELALAHQPLFPRSETQDCQSRGFSGEASYVDQPRQISYPGVRSTCEVKDRGVDPGHGGGSTAIEAGERASDASLVSIFHNDHDYTVDAAEGSCRNNLRGSSLLELVRRELQTSPQPNTTDSDEDEPRHNTSLHSDAQNELSELERALGSAQLRVRTLEEENGMLRKCLINLARRQDKMMVYRKAGSRSAEDQLNQMRISHGALQERHRALEEQIITLVNELREHGRILRTLVDEIDLPAQQSDGSPSPEEKKGETRDYLAAASRIKTQLDQSQEIASSLGGDLTPRNVLLMKLIQRQTVTQQAQDPGTSREESRKTRSTGFDTVLTPDQAAKFARSLDQRPELLTSVRIKLCSVCQIPKFLHAPVFSSSSRPASTDSLSSSRSSRATISTTSEFSDHLDATQQCCAQPVCDSCLLSSVVSSITKDWWHNLRAPYWIKCPAPSCDDTLPVRYNVDIYNILSALDDDDLLKHAMQFERATQLRRALECAVPAPTPEALERAISLHAQLAKHGRMCDMFDMQQPPPLTLRMLPVDSADGSRTLQVPVFSGFFICPTQKGRVYVFRRSSPSARFCVRDCVVCAESIRDLVTDTPEDEAHWVAATAGFSGDWTWQVRAFPPAAALPACRATHELNICRSCIGRHLATQLEARGRAGAETLSCPDPGCSHVYTHEEVRMLADGETFARYDKLRLLQHLSALPNFRWCLREGCPSGQIYDLPPGLLRRMGRLLDGATIRTMAAATTTVELGDSLRQRITCEACQFPMCFTHQVPWHAGQTCEQYDEAMRRFSSSSSSGGAGAGGLATRLWLATHTKRCPGPRCGVPVEKKGGCFHMTCQSCRAEFCWECLADWHSIVRPSNSDTGFRQRGVYDRQGHKPGCFFRSRDAPQPTMVIGNTIEEATTRLT